MIYQETQKKLKAFIILNISFIVIYLIDFKLEPFFNYGFDFWIPALHVIFYLAFSVSVW